MQTELFHAQHAFALVDRVREGVRIGTYPPDYLLVMDHLVWRRRPYGLDHTYASYSSMQRHLHLRRETFVDAVRDFESDGLLRKQHQTIQVTWGGGWAKRRAPNRYTFTRFLRSLSPFEAGEIALPTTDRLPPLRRSIAFVPDPAPTESTAFPGGMAISENRSGNLTTDSTNLARARRDNEDLFKSTPSRELEGPVAGALAKLQQSLREADSRLPPPDS